MFDIGFEGILMVLSGCVNEFKENSQKYGLKSGFNADFVLLLRPPDRNYVRGVDISSGYVGKKRRFW